MLPLQRVLPDFQFCLGLAVLLLHFFKELQQLLEVPSETAFVVSTAQHLAVALLCTQLMSESFVFRSFIVAETLG